MGFHGFSYTYRVGTILYRYDSGGGTGRRGRSSSVRGSILRERSSRNTRRTTTCPSAACLAGRVPGPPRALSPRVGSPRGWWSTDTATTTATTGFQGFQGSPPGFPRAETADTVMFLPHEKVADMFESVGRHTQPQIGPTFSRSSMSSMLIAASWVDDARPDAVGCLCGMAPTMSRNLCRGSR